MAFISHYARKLLRRFRKARFFYTPLIEIFIDSEALRHNVRTLGTVSGKAVAPVLKSNAYGHGLVNVASILDTEDVPFMCVDSFFEVLILRNEGIKKPVLMLGKTILDNILNNNLKDVAVGIINLEDIEKLSRLIKKETVFHIQLETGMHRHGVTETELQKIIALAKENPLIRIEGLYTHLADADTPNSQHAAKQIARWNYLIKTYQSQLPHLRYIHCAASAAVSLVEGITGNIIRVGRSLYGVNIGESRFDLRPVLEMRTKITSISDLEPGESVGYNATYTAVEKRRIASVPVGYAEGLDRRLSNKGALLVAGRACPIIGRISMNISLLDVTDAADVKIGDEVIVISQDPAAPNSIENMAKLCDTIPYEIAVHIPAQLRRTIR